ncbi:hypothetical protein OHB07_24185 [Streptomyces sp. NBC_00111]|uniref:hypothetical protein n=1 Tax=unclassified Streptomyces TaxID=2593676 RepID=UPI002E3221F5|nr:hypothetical protein [Streptomyces sp. NBC_01460]
MPVAITPRPLSQAEKAVAELVLAHDFPGAAELRAQVDHVQVVAKWGEHSASVDLRVGDDAPRSPGLSGVVPVDATVVDPTGSLFGEILLWATEGFLSAIEYAWYGDEPPSTLPDVAMITTEVRA